MVAHLRPNADAPILNGCNLDRQEMFEQTNAKSNRMHQLIVGRHAVALDKSELRTPELMAATDRAIGEVDVAYSRDSMRQDEAQTGVMLAGMRVPPAADFARGKVASRAWTSLDDGFNWTVAIAIPGHKTLRTGVICQFDLAALIWPNGRVQPVAAAGEAFAWNAPRPSLYVVRPDGYVAFRCDAEAGLLPDVRHLTAWLINNFVGFLTAHNVPIDHTGLQRT